MSESEYNIPDKHPCQICCICANNIGDNLKQCPFQIADTEKGKGKHYFHKCCRCLEDKCPYKFDHCDSNMCCHGKDLIRKSSESDCCKLL